MIYNIIKFSLLGLSIIFLLIVCIIILLSKIGIVSIILLGCSIIFLVCYKVVDYVGKDKKNN
jgi:hypothetical protein